MDYFCGYVFKLPESRDLSCLIYFQCQKDIKHIVGTQYLFIEWMQKFSLCLLCFFPPVVCLFLSARACPSGIFREE